MPIPFPAVSGTNYIMNWHSAKRPYPTSEEGLSSEALVFSRATLFAVEVVTIPLFAAGGTVYNLVAGCIKPVYGMDKDYSALLDNESIDHWCFFVIDLITLCGGFIAIALVDAIDPTQYDNLSKWAFTTLAPVRDGLKQKIVVVQGTPPRTPPSTDEGDQTH